MELKGSNGVSVSLRPDGYQFPDASKHDRDDANWLMIVGEVDSPEGAWTFRDPCMQTREARALGAWLTDVSRKAAAVREPDENGNVWPEWHFIEPNVGFGVEAYEGDDVVLRLHFSLESAPEWAGEETRSVLNQFFLRCWIGREDVGRAAETWMAELDEYPVRGDR